MRLGIHLPRIERKAGPNAIRCAAEQAEQLGFADVSTSEHIILPNGAPYPPSPSFYDPVLALTWAAAYTSRVRLGTSVLVLPMRHPLPLAKELATLQNLSGGRFILGAGVGWLEAEFEALGVPFHERGRRMDEGIAMMRAVWSDDPVTFEAKYVPAVIDNMRMQPKPEKPIPIWIGGTSEPALKRALRYEGWHGSRATPEQAAPIVARLRSERPGRLGIGAHGADQGRHEHPADAGTHPGLRRDDGDDVAGAVGRPLPVRHRALGAAGCRGLARRAVRQACRAHPRIRRDHPPGAGAKGAARASGRALPDPLYGTGFERARQAAAQHHPRRPEPQNLHRLDRAGRVAGCGRGRRRQSAVFHVAGTRRGDHRPDP